MKSLRPAKNALRLLGIFDFLRVKKRKQIIEIEYSDIDDLNHKLKDYNVKQIISKNVYNNGLPNKAEILIKI